VYERIHFILMEAFVANYKKWITFYSHFGCFSTTIL